MGRTEETCANREEHLIRLDHATGSLLSLESCTWTNWGTKEAFSLDEQLGSVDGQESKMAPEEGSQGLGEGSQGLGEGFKHGGVEGEWGFAAKTPDP